jgi:hypothetical protein
VAVEDLGEPDRVLDRGDEVDGVAGRVGHIGILPVRSVKFATDEEQSAQP